MIREVDPSGDADAVERLWGAYLSWGNEGLESRYGFRLPIDEFIERDLRSIAKFLPPDGKLLLAVQGNRPIGTSALQRISPKPPKSNGCGWIRLIAAAASAAPCSMT